MQIFLALIPINFASVRISKASNTFGFDRGSPIPENTKRTHTSNMHSVYVCGIQMYMYTSVCMHVYVLSHRARRR